MKKQIIILNGPPRSGKDEIGHYLATAYDFFQIKFAQPLRDAAYVFFDHEDIDEFKAMTFQNDKTGRDWMIGLSEQITKPIFGDDFFGVKAAQRVSQLERSRIVVTDAGFQTEVNAFIKTLRESESGHYTFEVWHVEREGCDYANDSRGRIWIKSSVPMVVENDGSIEGLKAKVDELLCSYENY